ncbi:unnamed protein product [Allacma fusca]|uniref:SLC26A/SulP transporter domain-containing protein n=1 Tax=Allacma fusca TaxID=39272 RepID=A0A8J2Q052_9HEXA|nr:unnamed protein product [Allacma fusca]
MKTELIHSYSSVSLSGISRSPSDISFSLNGNFSNSQTGLVGKDGASTIDDGNNNNNSSSSINDIPTDNSSPGCLKQWAKNTFRKKIFYRRMPILQWLPQYNLNKLLVDIIAGLTVGLTILPQGLAYATVGGLPPQYGLYSGFYGLYSGFVGCFVYIFFGGTKDVTIGPTAVMAIITLNYTVGKPPEYAVLLAFLTGIVTLCMGLFQLGFIVNFISTPVMSGFTSAAAITICSTQIKSLLGLTFPAEGFLDVFKGTVEHISDMKTNDALLSIVCIGVLLFLQNLQSIFRCCTSCLPALDKVLWLISTSRSAIVVVAATVAFTFVGDPAPVKVVGDITPGLPPFVPPHFSIDVNNTATGEVDTKSLLDILSEDGSALIVLPLLAIMEHITIAKALAGTSRVDASQEMITIGLSNLVGSFFCSMPITGSFSRTTVNHSSGVQSPLGGLVTGVLVILALQFLTPYFFFIPKPSLAAVIVCAVIFTVDLNIIYPMWKSKKMDLIPYGLTFIVSLVGGLAYGILVGFSISVMFLLYYAARPGIRVKRGLTTTGIEFIVCDLDRSLVFPSVEYSRYIVLKSGNVWANDTLPVVVDCQHIQFCDFTAAQGIRNLFVLFAERKQELILWKVKPSVLRIISGVMDSSGTPFKFCFNEAELERLLEEIVQPVSVEKGNGIMSDIRITFTSAEEDDSSNSSDASRL